MPYTHLTHEDRIQMALLRRLGHSLRSIARTLGKHHATISRELRRNAKPNKSGYDVRRARLLARERRIAAHAGRKKLSASSVLRRYVLRKLFLCWSPEQIAGRLRHEHRRTVSHETIYQWIYTERPDLKRYLRCQKGKYRRRHGENRRRRAREEEKRRIDDRPAVVEKRQRLGDWEGDTILGREKTVRILTHVERRSGLLLADKITDAKAEIVRAVAVERLRTVPRAKRHTVTYDNGLEFTEHEFIERDAGVTVYFSYPYHSWERGTNENANGLLRQFFPKGMPFSGITQQQIDQVVMLINNRPRKRHHFLTPAEVFRKGGALLPRI